MMAISKVDTLDLARQWTVETLLKYKLRQDKELFEKAYGYIREYY
jgi:hypothetical protein